LFVGIGITGEPKSGNPIVIYRARINNLKEKHVRKGKKRKFVMPVRGEQSANRNAFYLWKPAAAKNTVFNGFFALLKYDHFFSRQIKKIRKKRV